MIWQTITLLVVMLLVVFIIMYFGLLPRAAAAETEAECLAVDLSGIEQQLDDIAIHIRSIYIFIAGSIVLVGGAFIVYLILRPILYFL